MKHEMVVLNADQRHSVEAAVRETCDIRKWDLFAVNVRTNHAHAVVSIGSKKPEVALNAFKANATRKMRESGSWKGDSSPWSDKGSKRYLWNEQSVSASN